MTLYKLTVKDGSGAKLHLTGNVEGTPADLEQLARSFRTLGLDMTASEAGKRTWMPTAGNWSADGLFNDGGIAA